MRTWLPLVRFVHDHQLFVALFCGAGVIVVLWILVELFRKDEDRESILRLRQRLYEIERDRSAPSVGNADTLLLTPRWIRSGAAATTSDGGCLIYIERVLANQSRALLTVRVDGYAVKQGHLMRTDQSLEVEGKAGIYVVRMPAVDGINAYISVAWRNRYIGAEDNQVD